MQSKGPKSLAAGLAAVCLTWLCARPVAADSPDAPSGPAPAVRFSLASPSGLDVSRAPAIVRKPKTARAWIEWGAFMAYSGGSYWIRYKGGAFIEDWQFPLKLKAQFKRVFLFEGWRFDSNNFKLNWTHSLAGGIYYQFARTNDMSWLQSWLMACIGSTTWESLVEWREVISLNDQIMTGLGGFATGEPWYQIGEYLGHQASFVLRALGWINPPLKFNHWLDRKDPATKDYIPPAWHDLGLTAGVRQLAATGKPAETAAYLGVHTQLLTLPDYGKSGDLQETVKDTYSSEISLDYAIRNGHADETNLNMGAVAWGYFRQKIDENLVGYSLTIGLGSSFEYFKKKPIDYYDSAQLSVNPTDLGEGLGLDQPRNFTDKLAIAHVAGPVLDWTIFRRGLKLRTVAKAFFDFGLINSLALNGYSQLHHTLPDDTIRGMKETLVYYGYYYGFGGTVSGQTNLEWGGFRARALASFGAWGSADFRDRFAGQITNNAHGDDNRFRYLVGAGWKMPRAPVELFVNYEGLQRWGRLLEVRARSSEKRLFAGVEFSF